MPKVRYRQVSVDNTPYYYCISRRALRINPEQVAEWSDEEVAQRWMKISRGPLLMHQYLGNTDLAGAELPNKPHRNVRISNVAFKTGHIRCDLIVTAIQIG